VLMPRVFGHAHFATLEMPLLLTWMLTVIAFEKGTRSALWSVAAGAAFGLALLTRFNAVFLPLFLVPWGALVHRRKVLPNVAAMAVLSPLVFLAGWPAMWRGPFDALRIYVGTKFSRMVVPMAYFGNVYPNEQRAYPTPDYPFVMTVLTVPLLLLAAALWGGIVAFGRRETPAPGKASRDAARGRASLLLFAMGGPLLLMALPASPRYDGVRLFLPVFPFLAALAGIGIAHAWTHLSRIRRRGPVVAVGVAALALLIAPLVLLHPYPLAYYNGLIGGPWGADRLGMETVYWNESFNENVLRVVGQALPEGGRVALAGVGSQVDDLYRAAGLWPEKVQVTDFEKGDWNLLVVVPRKGWLQRRDPKVWRYRREHAPWRTWFLTPARKVPVCEIYARGAGPP